jgi:hypothetical protein
VKGAVQRQKCRSKAKGTQKIPDNLASKSADGEADFNEGNTYLLVEEEVPYFAVYKII